MCTGEEKRVVPGNEGDNSVNKVLLVKAVDLSLSPRTTLKVSCGDMLCLEAQLWGRTEMCP